MTSRSRIAWASVAMTLSVLLGVSAVGAAPMARAADEPVPAFAVDLAISPRTVAGGTWVTATVTVISSGTDVYPDALVAVAMNWDSAAVSVGSGAEQGPTGCLAILDPVTAVSQESPSPGDECVLEVARDPATPSVFTFRFRPSGVPPALMVVTAQVTGGYLQESENFTRVVFADADVTSDQDYIELGPVFSAAVTVDRKVSTTGYGNQVIATFTVTHEPSAAPNMSGSQVLFAINWPTFFTHVGGTAAEVCDGGLEGGFCAITEPTGARRTSVFTMVFDVPYGTGGQGGVSIIGQGGWYVPPGPILSRAPLEREAPITRAASLGDPAGGVGGGPGGARGTARIQPADVQAAIVKAAPTPRPTGALDIPGTWTGVASASVIALNRPFPMDVQLRPTFSTLGEEEGIEGVIRVRHDEAAAVTLFGLTLDIEIDADDALVPIGDPVGCVSYVAGVCTIEGLDAPGSEVEITLEFEPPDEIGIGYLYADQIAGRFTFDGGVVDVPDPWLWRYAYGSQITDAELVALDVDLNADYVWEGGPHLGASIRATRAERLEDESYSYDLYDELIVGIAITWPDYLTPLGDPTGCDAWDGLICEVRLSDAGSEGAAVIGLEFEIGPGVVDGVVRAEGAYLLHDPYSDSSEEDGDDYEDLPVEWVVPDEAPVAGIEPFIPLDVQLSRESVWEGGPNLIATVTATREDFVSDGLRDPFWGRLLAGVSVTWPDYLTPLAIPSECTLQAEGMLCHLELPPPGSETDPPGVSLTFAVGAGVTDGVVRAEGAYLQNCDVYYSDAYSDCESSDDDFRQLPIEWVVPDEEPVAGVATLIPLDVAVDRDLVWEGGANLGATITATRNAFPETRRDPFGRLVVDVEISWPEFLELVGTPTGCESWDGTICVIVLGRPDAEAPPGPGPTAVIGLEFSVGEAPAAGLDSGVVRAEATRLRACYGDSDGGCSGACEDFEECEDLPTAWVTPDEASVTRIRVAIPMSVDVERDLVWQGGSDVGATVVVTRYGPDELDGFDPLGVLAVEVEITWPAFLHPVGAPTGCESWDGSICVVVLPEPIYEVAVGLEFSVVGTPPGGVVAGEVRAVGVGLVNRTPEADQELPEAWVTPDADTVTRIKGSVSLDLTLGHDPGYTGGKQLVVTTKVTRETTGPELPDLEVGLDFAWAAYLTRIVVTGCESFTGTTCIVTGLDDPGASAVVKLTFTMPAPALPPVPEVLPRTDDISVDGVRLSFVPPEAGKPSSGAALGSSPAALGPIPADTGSLPPPPLDGTLPPSWIGQDRAPFTVLQPNIVIAQSVAAPGDAVTAYGKYLPPDAEISLRWEGLATMAAQQWPNPDAPTESSWSLVILRWQFAGPRTLIMHSEDGLFADIPSSNQLLVVPRSAAGPDLVGRGG